MAAAPINDDSLFECTICLETFDEPKLLPCFHTFCKKCLTAHIKRNKRKGNVFPCPNCRTHVKVPPKEADGFQTNFYVIAARSSEELLKSRLLEISTVVSNSGKDGEDGCLFEQPCPKHRKQNQMLQFYCSKCDIPICLHCKLTSHEGHDTRDLEDILHCTKDELKEKSETIQSFILKYKAARESAEGIEKKMDHKLQELKASVIGNAEHLHDLVDNRKKILLDMITKSQRKETNKVIQYQKTLEKNNKQMKDLVEQINKEQNKHDVQTLLKLKTTVSEKMKTIDSTPPQFNPDTNEVTYERAANQNGKAREMISNFMGEIVSKDISQQHGVSNGLPDTPVAVYQYGGQVYVLIWGKGSAKGVMNTDKKTWLFRNNQELRLKKPNDFMVTKEGGLLTVVICDPVSQQVIIMQENRGTFYIKHIYKGEGLDQPRNFVPKGLTMSVNNELHVSDEGNSFILQLNINTGRLISLIHISSIGIRKPRAIQFSKDGMWVADSFGGFYLIHFRISSLEDQRRFAAQLNSDDNYPIIL
ncbi:tripartite motif-containing protein 2 isoform X2 [Patella vulgata]|uniref:tripartite motif-containing protein 2 isoform X2 n=1 Tax=Patella vulgata TaxID=6465 RepID=UPI00217FCD2D|nr:tripartite motif-containing protein 2 isoform X2 [Patella vulgata]